MSKAAKSNTKPTTETVVEQVVETKPVINHDYNELLKTHKTKSGIIRFLAAEGHSRGQIAKFMDIKYQFVRNVLITPVGKKA